MPTCQQFVRIDTLELKSQIEKKIGRARTDRYINLLSKFLSCKLSKSEFNRLCIAIVGRDNIHLHNDLIRGLAKNACLSKTRPLQRNGLETSLGEKKELNGLKRSISLQSLCKELPQSPRKGRTPNARDRRFKDTKGKSQINDVVSCGGRPLLCVEDGEVIDQSTLSPEACIKSQPIEAPLGIGLRETRTKQKMFAGSHRDTCYSMGELHDTVTLKKKLDQTLKMEGLQASLGFTNLLNTGLNVFLKRLIKPCLELAGSKSRQGEIHREASSNGLWSERSVEEKRVSVTSASLVDFLAAMELNPSILGEDWPTKLEMFRLLAPDELSSHKLTL